MMVSNCTENRSIDKYLNEGLSILARIIIRKYIKENMEKEGNKENETNCIRSSICDQ